MTERRSIYVPDHLWDFLDLPADGDGLSSRVAAIVDRYRQIVWAPGACERWTRPEWLLVLDACNGWASWAEAGETLMTSIWAEVADHVRLNDAAAKWGLSAEQAEALAADLRSLTAAGTMAVLERVERFWRRADLPTAEAMAAARIRPTD